MPITNTYIKDADRCSLPVFMPGEEYSFYINFDSPIGDPDFDDFELGIAEYGIVVQPNIGTLQKDIIAGSTLYNIYCTFIFPDIPAGFYTLAIYNKFSDVIKAQSNNIVASRDDFYKASSIVQYRNQANIYGFNYEGLPDFYNRVRLLINRVDLQYDTDRQQYRNVTDSLYRNIKNYRDKIVTAETYYFDDLAHEAITAMCDHDQIYINEGSYTPKSAYSISNRQQSLISKGTVDLYELNAYALDIEFNEHLDFNAQLVDAAYNVTGTVSAMGDVKFYFDRILSIEGLPTTMELKFNGVLFMVVDFVADYLGKPWKILKYQGRELRGVFTAGEVNIIT